MQSAQNWIHKRFSNTIQNTPFWFDGVWIPLVCVYVCAVIIMARRFLFGQKSHKVKVHRSREIWYILKWYAKWIWAVFNPVNKIDHNISNASPTQTIKIRSRWNLTRLKGSLYFTWFTWLLIHLNASTHNLEVFVHNANCLFENYQYRMSFGDEKEKVHI